MGWVHGGGTPVGMLAEMLAAGLNANLGGRDHMPIEVERQIPIWMRELFGFPESASGLFVTGTSMANLMAVLVARTTRAGHSRCAARASPPAASASSPIPPPPPMAASRQAIDLAGLGSEALRRIAIDERQRMDLAALAAAIAEDRGAGLHALPGRRHRRHGGCRRDRRSRRHLPISRKREGIWFHVDAAYGALAHAGAGSGAAVSAASSGRIPSPSISTNGARCPMTRAISWCATASAIARASPHRPPICAGRRAGLPPARPGPAISAPTSRADSAPSRPGSPSRSMAPRRWGRRCREAARWPAISSRRSRQGPSWNCWPRPSSISSASATAPARPIG